MILPVSYAVVGDDLVFRVGDGLIAAAARRGDIACFQADRADEQTLDGWSVSAIGPLALLDDPIVLARAEVASIPQWSSSSGRFVRLQPSLTTGRMRWTS